MLTIPKCLKNKFLSGVYPANEFDNNTYILANGPSGVPYVGGEVRVYKVFSATYGLEATLSGGNYSYIRKVYGVDGLAVAGEGVSDVYISSEHVTLKIE